MQGQKSNTEKTQNHPSCRNRYYKWIYESLSPPFAQAGVASKYIDCLTNMVYHKNDNPDIVAVENWFKNNHDKNLQILQIS